MKTPIIDKKDIDISHLRSINTPVGDNMPLLSSINHLKLQAERATLLGNGQKSKVNILIQTDKGIRSVNTTVWASTDQYIILKEGKAIPMDTIIDIVE